jgi:hypothetical protein
MAQDLLAADISLSGLTMCSPRRTATLSQEQAAQSGCMPLTGRRES